MIVVDTNVIIDILQDDARWGDWSAEQLSRAQDGGQVGIVAVVVAELSRDFGSLDALQRALSPLMLAYEPLDERSAFEAGRRYVAGQRDRVPGDAKRPLADFFIGAHALIRGAPLLTRDPKLYRRYFPDLTLITPETHP